MNIIISNSGNLPIYEQITNQIKDMIMRGELRGGEALPSMRALAKDLHISVITTKRAFDDLGPTKNWREAVSSIRLSAGAVLYRMRIRKS